MQILEVEKRHALFVGHAEGDVQDALLRLGQIHQAAEQERPHFRQRGAHRVALLAEQVPEGHREGRIAVIVETDGRGAFGEGFVQFEIRAARRRQPREVALDVGQEHRNSGSGKALGQDLQRDGLAGAGRPGDQSVPVGVFQRQPLPDAIVRATAANEYLVVHVTAPCRIYHAVNIQP